MVLDNAVSYLDFEVIEEVDFRAHTIFIGKAMEAKSLNDDGPKTCICLLS